MEVTTEAVDPSPDDPASDAELSAVALNPAPGAAVPATAAPPQPRSRRRSPALRRVRTRVLTTDMRRELLWITVVYLAARILILLAAVLLDAFGHRPLQSELANWDGMWYRAVANHGYPHQISHHQTNLGFFPLFPVTIRLVSPILQLVFGAGPIWGATYAGVLISGIGGLIATVFVHRLAEGWWDRATARRATLIFVLFPGSVVFSMVYSEALLMPLVAVCIWALERRRWVLAGVMGGLGTAVQPIGLLFGLVIGICALRELWRHGPRSREFVMSALATAMSAVGALAFAVFLWAWTGSPTANYTAQHYGWGEKTDPLALIWQVKRLIPSFDPAHFNHPPIDLNYVLGTVGALLMLWLLWLLWRSRREVSLPAIVWTLGTTFFMATSEYVPPNPRLLITAFPMLILLARWARPRRFAVLVATNAVFLVGLSLLTFYHHILRP